jgi:hypothetical protein
VEAPDNPRPLTGQHAPGELISEPVDAHRVPLNHNAGHLTLDLRDFRS